MSVQVRRRRESAAFLASFVGAQGELLVDTTNNRVQVHDGTTPGGWPAAKLADVAQRTAVADANYAALPTDRTIAFTALTAARTVTLPSVAAFPTGTQLLVVDEAGACSPALAVTVARSGSDTINGAAAAAITGAYGFLALIGNGKAAWTLVDFAGATTAQLTNRNAVINGNFAINQRSYSGGTALAAGGYGHDRWKAGSGGGAYSFSQAVPDTAIALSSGTLLQVVEGSNVAAPTMWLSWVGTAGARVYQGSPASQTSPPYAPGTAVAVGGTTVNALAIGGLTPGTNAAVEFSGGSVGLVQLEVALPNAGPTRFERRHLAQELLLCQRYFQRWSPPPLRGIASSSTYLSRMGMVLPVAMRAAPNATMGGQLSVYNGANGGKCSSVAASYCSQTTMELDLNIPSSLNIGAGQFVLSYQNYDGAAIDLAAEL